MQAVRVRMTCFQCIDISVREKETARIHIAGGQFMITGLGIKRHQRFPILACMGIEQGVVEPPDNGRARVGGNRPVRWKRCAGHS